MRVLIEIPTWLGDAVMATPAIENLLNFYDEADIILVGSAISIEALKSHPKISEVYIYDKKYFSLLRLAKRLGPFDVFFSFRSSIRSIFFKFLIISKKNYQFDRKKYTNIHQVQKYNNFLNDSLDSSFIAGKLQIFNGLDYQKSHINTIEFYKSTTQRQKMKLLGISPGANYGSAKCWYPEEFAKVSFELSNQYNIIILGGPSDTTISDDIEKSLLEIGVINFHNLAGKTTISELIDIISKLDLFITGDSGPMHLAAAFQIPTVSIFGPTRDVETSQWMNKKSSIVKKNLECQPCMKRVCPLGHHNCMKLIDSERVINNVLDLNLNA